MRKYNKNGIAPFDAKNVLIGDVEDETVIQVYTEDGTKMVHYFGYGYYAEDDGPKSYRWVDYSFLIATAKEIIAAGGITAWESENQDDCKQYIEDCTEEEIVRGYKEFDAGNPPDGYLDEQSFSDNTPDGFYVVVPTVECFEMNITVRFNREILGDEAFSSGRSGTMIPWEMMRFDYPDSKDGAIVHFYCSNLGCNSSVIVRNLTTHGLEIEKEIENLFVDAYEEEGTEPPKIIEVLSINFNEDGHKMVEVPQNLINECNKYI